MTSGSLQTSEAVFRMPRTLMQRIRNTRRMPRTQRPLGDLLLCPPPLCVFKVQTKKFCRSQGHLIGWMMCLLMLLSCRFQWHYQLPRPTLAAGDITILLWCSFDVLMGFRGGCVSCQWMRLSWQSSDIIGSCVLSGDQRYCCFCLLQLSPIPGSSFPPWRLCLCQVVCGFADKIDPWHHNCIPSVPFQFFSKFAKICVSTTLEINCSPLATIPVIKLKLLYSVHWSQVFLDLTGGICPHVNDACEPCQWFFQLLLLSCCLASPARCPSCPAFYPDPGALCSASSAFYNFLVTLASYQYNI